MSTSADVPCWNVGLCFGVLEFVSTFAITLGYDRWARRKLDPLAGRIQVRALTRVGAERGSHN